MTMPEPVGKMGDRWCVDRGRIIERGETLRGSMAKYPISWKWPGFPNREKRDNWVAVVINETKLSNCFCFVFSVRFDSLFLFFFYIRNESIGAMLNGGSETHIILWRGWASEKV